MTATIEVTEVALAMETRQIDLAPVVLVETYRRLDRISNRCRHYHDYGALVQVWLAGHLGMEIVHPQRFAFKTYYSSGHARAIQSVREEYEKLAKLTEDAVTWRIVPSTAESFTVFFSTHDMRLVVLPGFTRDVGYHPIWVMWLFGFQRGAYVDSTTP